MGKVKVSQRFFKFIYNTFLKAFVDVRVSIYDSQVGLKTIVKFKTPIYRSCYQNSISCFSESKTQHTAEGRGIAGNGNLILHHWIYRIEIFVEMG